MHLIKICAEEKISGGEFLLHLSSIILVNTKHLVSASIICCDTAEQNCHRIFAPYLQKVYCGRKDGKISLTDGIYELKTIEHFC